jgi:hypothetical protein
MMPHPPPNRSPETGPVPVVTMVYDGQESPERSAPPQTRTGAGQSFSRSRLVMALTVAGMSDLLSFGCAFLPPVQWGVDLITAFTLFAVLGWRWMFLPALILEAIPGLAALPVWTLVVASIASYGTIRSDLKPPAAPSRPAPRP